MSEYQTCKGPLTIFPSARGALQRRFAVDPSHARPSLFNQTLKEVDNVQWARLFGIDVTASTIGSFIGSGLILALTIWLTNLPH